LHQPRRESRLPDATSLLNGISEKKIAATLWLWRAAGAMCEAVKGD